MVMRKVMVCGGRTFDDDETLFSVLDGLCNVYPVDPYDTTIISGGARGADSLANEYAHSRGLELIECPADWERYGKSAGYRRNADMVKQADVVVAFWDGESKGTKHSIDLTLAAGKPLLVVTYG